MADFNDKTHPDRNSDEVMESQSPGMSKGDKTHPDRNSDEVMKSQSSGMSKGDKKTSICFISLIVVTCVQLSTLSGMVAVWYGNRIRLLVPKQQRICSKWEQVGSAETEQSCPEELEKNQVKDNAVCCGTASVVFDKLVTKILLERYNSDINPEHASMNLSEFNCNVSETMQPYAILFGLSHHRKPVLVGTSSKVFWNPDTASISTSHLKHLQHDGTIYVNLTGYYFVESQIKLILDDATRRPNGVLDDTFRHYVHLISNDGIGSTLLENTKHRCNLAAPTSELTSSVGATFKLDNGDRLYVATSHPHLLETHGTGSNFNIHKI